MADISALGALAASEPLDLEIYKDYGERRPFPRRGRYTLRAPETFPATAFGLNKKGTALTAQIDPTIVGPTNDGFKMRYTRISAATWKRDGKPVSQLGEYLRACGRRGTVSGDPQEQADAVEQTANLTYVADLDWRLFAKGEARLSDGTATGEDLVIEGMDNFPQNEKGERVPYVPSISKLDDNGDPVMLRANLEILRFVPAA